MSNFVNQCRSFQFANAQHTLIYCEVEVEEGVWQFSHLASDRSAEIIAAINANDIAEFVPTAIEVVANNEITIGSLWDRFTLAERIFIRQASNPLLIRDENSTVAQYDAIIEDIKDGLKMYSYISITDVQFQQVVGYMCNAFLAANLIDDIETRVNELLIAGTESEKFNGVL
jgi:hypothetical protein